MNPRLAQPHCRQYAAKATTDDEHVELLGHRRTGEAGLDIGILVEVCVDAAEVDVLDVAVRTQPLRALDPVLRLQRSRRK